MSARYQVESVTKVYNGRIVANDGIDLAIRAGEVFGLLGPNGAGKSTLVRQMVGLLAPDQGRILYDGSPVAPRDARLKRRVAYLSQRPLALLDLTVREAISWTARLRGLRPDRIGRATDAILDELDLAGCAGQIVAHLSGGQHRLVALGTALVGDTETLVLDEPTSELDPEMRRRVWQSLRARCARGATVVLVTHHALEAEQIIDRVAVLMNGKVVAIGTPGEIKARVDARVRVELTLRGDAATILPRLAGLGTIERGNGSAVVLAAPRDEARRLIDGVLGSVSWDELDDFRVLTPTLEDIYMAVSGRLEPAMGG